MKINHMGLAVTEVLGTAEIFQKYFDLVIAPGTHCTAKMAFLADKMDH